MKELKEIPKPIGNYIMNNAIGKQGGDGMYYHYSDVCRLVKNYHKREVKKLRLSNISGRGELLADFVQYLNRISKWVKIPETLIDDYEKSANNH